MSGTQQLTSCVYCSNNVTGLRISAVEYVT